MNTLSLNDSKEIPAIGFGTYQAKGQEGIYSVHQALEAGYRLIDTASFYKNEKEVGQGIINSGIIENFDVFDFELSATDIKVIDQLPQMGFTGLLPNEW